MNTTSTLIYPSSVLILLFVSNPLGQATPVFSWQFTYRFNQSESNYDCVRGEDLLQLWDKFEMLEEFSFYHQHRNTLLWEHPIANAHVNRLVNFLYCETRLNVRVWNSRINSTSNCICHLMSFILHVLTPYNNWYLKLNWASKRNLSLLQSDIH